MRQSILQRAINLMNTTPIDGGLSPHELIYGTPIVAPVSSGKVRDEEKRGDGGNKALREEIAELVEGIQRGRRVRSTKAVPDDLEPPPLTIGTNPDKDTDDSDGDGAVGFPRGGADNLDRENLAEGPREDSARTGRGTGDRRNSEGSGDDIVEAIFVRNPGSVKRTVLTVRQLRRVLASKESLFKFGTFVPRSEREADDSPEAPRWRAGRDLE